MNLFDIFGKKHKKTPEPQIKTELNEAVQRQGEHVSASQSINTGNINKSNIYQIYQHIEKNSAAVSIIDQKIIEELDVIRKSRFFAEFNTHQSALALARRLVEDDLYDGSSKIRSMAIAWCARLLAYTDLENAEHYLRISKTLCNCPEIEIAEAFICSEKDDKSTALKILAKIDMSIARSAAFMIIMHHDGSNAAVEWLKTIGSINDLDSDGKYFLIVQQFELGYWEAVIQFVDNLSEADFRTTPILHNVVAIAHLSRAVPDEYRSIIMNQIPFNSASFPLAADADSMKARSLAHQQYAAAADIALKLNCPNAARLCEKFVLWLELRDPTQSAVGLDRLKEKLRNPKEALHIVPLGLDFGIKLDLDLVEEEIERQIALHGEITQDAAITRFALAFTKKSPEDIASYIARHRDQLSKFFDNKVLQFFEIEMLAQANMPEKAKERLNSLAEKGLTDAEERRLQKIIADIDGTNPLEIIKKSFKETNNITDLMNLVLELEAQGKWDDLCTYSEILFTQTRSLDDAKRFAKTLHETQEHNRLVEFLRENAILMTQSSDLHILYCWALYYEGSLIEARTELHKLSNNRDDRNYRTLQVLIGIALGDWNSLTTFVATEYSNRDQRSATELLSAAQLAHDIGSPYAKELAFLAVKKESNSAEILASAYFLATKAGWENDNEASQWLMKAIQLSDEHGPLQKKALKDVVDMNPDWNRRVTETGDMLSRGSIPMFIAGESLNRSLIEMQLYPAILNLAETDPRRKSIIPTYSGNHVAAILSTEQIIGLDASTLITLSFLHLLDKVFAAFNNIYIPHSTMKWLFEEKQKVAFHQPSRIKNARKLQGLITSGVLEGLAPDIITDSDLSEQIGYNLASLITEAKKACQNMPCIVVSPYPVTRVASLMEEEADLTEYSELMSSCQAIVKKLRNKGQITLDEETRILSYLQLHEKFWPNQPEISDGATLYLDDIATHYFHQFDLLEKIRAAGHKIIISSREVKEANELAAYENVSEQISDLIEVIRSSVNTRIESGQIKVGARSKLDNHLEGSFSEHPSVEIFMLAQKCDSVIIDDRFMNQHSTISVSNVQKPVFTTLDILNMLVSIGAVSIENLYEYKTMLRRAGFIFIPIDNSELEHLLDTAAVADNRLVETAELKSLRESVRLVCMRSWLQYPKEAHWFDTFMKIYINVLKHLWTLDTEINEITIKSNWLFSQIDFRLWVHCIGEGIIRPEYIMFLMLPPIEASTDMRAEYLNWFEETILVPVKQEYPDLYLDIITRIKKNFASIEEIDLEGVFHE